jgi:hypothetical protein
MAKTKKTATEVAPSQKKVNQGIYGMNANNSSIKKGSIYTPGSELTGTIK